MIKSLVFLVTLLFVGLACSAVDESEQSKLNFDMTSASSDLREHLEIIGERAQSLLAYGVANTGCDYRAYFLSMELAASQIASSAFYANAFTGFRLKPTTDITWQYHVAAYVQIVDEVYILDPTFVSLGKSEEKVLTKNQWLSYLGANKQVFWQPSHGDTSIREYYFPGSFSLLDSLRTREMGMNANLSEEQLDLFVEEQDRIKRVAFDEMQVFQMSDINEACKSLVYLNKRLNEQDLGTRQALVARFEELIAALDEQSKLGRDQSFFCEL